MSIVVSVSTSANNQSILDVTRSDVYELVLNIIPLLRQQKRLSEKVWLQTLGCCGVCELKGVRQSNTASEIKGRLTTHPPLSVHLQLETEGELEETRHCLIHIVISESQGQGLQ